MFDRVSLYLLQNIVENVFLLSEVWTCGVGLEVQTMQWFGNISRENHTAKIVKYFRKERLHLLLCMMASLLEILLATLHLLLHWGTK